MAVKRSTPPRAGNGGLSGTSFGMNALGTVDSICGNKPAALCCCTTIMDISAGIRVIENTNWPLMVENTCRLFKPMVNSTRSDTPDTSGIGVLELSGGIQNENAAVPGVVKKHSKSI